MLVCTYIRWVIKFHRLHIPLTDCTVQDCISLYVFPDILIQFGKWPQQLLHTLPWCYKAVILTPEGQCTVHNGLYGIYTPLSDHNVPDYTVYTQKQWFFDSLHDTVLEIHLFVMWYTISRHTSIIHTYVPTHEVIWVRGGYNGHINVPDCKPYFLFLLVFLLLIMLVL